MSNTLQYDTMSKDELRDHVEQTFKRAGQYVERNEPIPHDVWIEINKTAQAICNKAGIELPQA